MSNKLEEIYTKNGACYNFYDIANINDLDFHNP